MQLLGKGSLFREHPFIKSITNIPKWTFSDGKKMPIDAYEFIHHDTLRGANFYDDKSLVKLTQLDSFIDSIRYNGEPIYISNRAFYLEARFDRFIVLDIEKTCPEETKQYLLSTPYIYGEVSMSGLGYHLIYPIPGVIYESPNIQYKPTIKKGKDYEILLNHFCTFTGNMIPPCDNPQHDIADICKDIISDVKYSTAQRTVNIDDIWTDPGTEQSDYLMELLSVAGNDYRKTPADFDNDMSRYEWAFIAYLVAKLHQILHVQRIANEGHKYTDNEKAYYIYTIAEDILPHRDKHDTYRSVNNVKLPWLGYLINDALSKYEYDKYERKN